MKSGGWRGCLGPLHHTCVDGKEIKNSLLRVEKSRRTLPDGTGAQRLIVDLRASNAVLRVIAGNIVWGVRWFQEMTCVHHSTCSRCWRVGFPIDL